MALFSLALSELAGVLTIYVPYQVAFASLFGYILLIFVVLHAFRTLHTRAFVFLGIAFIAGAGSELLGTTYGWIYGQNYYYTAPDKVFGLVPISVLYTWVVVIYLAYSITNVINPSNNSLTPKKSFDFGSVGSVALLSILDGFLAMSLDMIIDPVYVHSGTWVWQGGGAYFGIPLSNFVGWFFVAFTATIIFRISSLLRPFDMTQKVDFIFFSPVIAYLIFGIVRYGILAYVLGHVEYSEIGTAVMFPFIIIATLAYQLKRSKIDYVRAGAGATKDS